MIVRYGSDVGIGRDIPLALADALGVERQRTIRRNSGNRNGGPNDEPER